MNHLTQISLINMILKWHYINMLEKIDSFSVVKHGFCLIWLWSHPLSQLGIPIFVLKLNYLPTYLIVYLV